MRYSARPLALAALSIALIGVPNAAHATAPSPSADLCGAVNGDYTHGQDSHTFTGTLTHEGQPDEQMAVTFWAGPPSTTAVIQGPHTTDTVIALGAITNSDGHGGFSFQTPDGWAYDASPACAEGSTSVTTLEGHTDTGTFSLTG